MESMWMWFAHVIDTEPEIGLPAVVSLGTNVRDGLLSFGLARQERGSNTYLLGYLTPHLSSICCEFGTEVSVALRTWDVLLITSRLVATQTICSRTLKLAKYRDNPPAFEAFEAFPKLNNWLGLWGACRRNGFDICVTVVQIEEPRFAKHSVFSLPPAANINTFPPTTSSTLQHNSLNDIDFDC
jgi:hypothetical protein